jgi:uncharacterized protein YkwD
MGRRLRTIILLVGVGVAALIAPPASATADVGDLLGMLSGEGPTPSQPAPPEPRPPNSGGTGSPNRPVQPPKGLLAPESSCPGQTDPSLSAAAQERAMVCMQSYARVAAGLHALRAYTPLRISATHKARDIRRCQVLSHDACGRDMSYWIARVGFFKGIWMVGEVLAVGGRQNGTVRATMTSWLHSKPHRAVLLHPGFDLVGVGTVRGTFHGFRGTRIWVAHLGYRR